MPYWTGDGTDAARRRRARRGFSSGAVGEVVEEGVWKGYRSGPERKYRVWRSVHEGVVRLWVFIDSGSKRKPYKPAREYDMKWLRKQKKRGNAFATTEEYVEPEV